MKSLTSLFKQPFELWPGVVCHAAVHLGSRLGLRDGLVLSIFI